LEGLLRSSDGAGSPPAREVPVAAPKPAPQPSGRAAAAPALAPTVDPDPDPVEHSHAAPALGTVVASWPAVVERVREGNLMLAALLADARPVDANERELIVAFPAGADFLKRKAEQDDYRRVAADALRTVTGHALTLRYELRADEQQPEAPGEVSISGEELVRRFLEEFDAEEILEDDPEETA
jgi:DNA polymerase III subunit gamma/tau